MLQKKVEAWGPYRFLIARRAAHVGFATGLRPTKAQRAAAANRAAVVAAGRVPDFAVVNFGQMFGAPTAFLVKSWSHALR